MEIKMSLIPGGKNGKAGKINVKLGDKVSVGDILVQVETGKGNRPIKAAEEGIITKILFDEGSEITSNQVLFKLDANKLDSHTQSPVSQQTSSSEKETNDLKSELLIIGAGPGGYVAAIYAAKKGLQVTLIEKEELGGTCLNVGCIPTKSLVKSSEICHNVKNSSLFGIKAETDIQVDMKQVIRRKDEVKEKLVSGIGYLMEKNEIQVIHGDASFLSANTVSVNGEKNYRISAKNIIVATGSKIAKVNIPGIDLPFVMNSTDALSCAELPKSITIIGGGVIGMEFAFIYRNLGVEVHVVEFMDRLLTMLDRDISEEIAHSAQQAGIHIHTNSKVSKIQRADDDQAIVTYEDAKGEHLLVSDKVLVAIGREPNLDGLEIEKSSIQLNERGKGIAVNKQMRTNVEHIYAIGDVTNIMQLAHVASHQGITAIDAILGESSEMHYSAVPNVIFTSPEIASVGLLEDECRERAMDYSVSKVSFASNGKALTMNESEGFIKLIKDTRSQKIVGGSIIGPDASSLISSLTLAIANELTEQQITQTIFAHPTTGEVIHEAAFGLGIGALHQA
ncbi:Dihydrolipoyl dehydrogenase [Neobacillus rhizosphaerae]|uniref:Dihydrolipoyl dehydrogenase n=1 Tax=Neobacillus rhizosphaerae TaxID=2880965 RepID=A0ABN8KVJ8_9BACI|nr:dihydrolipoyl dehydrogenase [Neobacillus rhizosphaerae]CAH2716555.1 Dihydrolipoyl dehydrogenase [Neobacillus rhizosphaerae]